MPKFSIITPTWNRADGRLQQCMVSVLNQVYQDFEHVIVDDGSTDSTNDMCQDTIGQGFPVRYIQIEHSGRIAARNLGMAEATGDWFLWLDSDDALDPMYLDTLAYHIQRQPEVKLWTVGVVMHGMVKEGSQRVCPAWTKLRPAWIPPGGPGKQYRIFRSGKIGTGMFVYRRECYEKIGGLPDDWTDHKDVADGLDGWLELPEGATGYSAAKRWVGNPIGDDHAYFARLCQFYWSYKIDACLYVHYVR